MDFERLGAFYMGKEYDLTERRLLDRLVMYDSRDLTTHAVCIGMTGSGKTGLCISLLEEAAIDGIPAIIIDPKGDIANLLLCFPDLAAADFLPWINPDDARRKGLSPDAFAAEQAAAWRAGLASWGQDGARIRMLRDAADITIYTPGSDAGIPVSILHSFAAPDLSWESDAEILREKISGTVTALLGLIGVAADPVRSREHILLSTLFEHAWRNGTDLDLVSLIRQIQDPPVRQIGAFDIETFFPSKERFGFAMQLNNLIAAPGFQRWTSGQPFDIPGFLTAPGGKPRHAIFYLAHLNDAERMFFVTLLLYQILAWVRTQTGTTSLRALLYMDEIFGFFPPTANPPSKQPMLTLLKQARAFGLGVVLTTQNPVDLDYKGLANTGTWFIGRLQTDQDRARVLDGLTGVHHTSRESLARILASLDKRVFLLHNVHAGAPLTFQTRWAMSYLRGPLSRDQVRALMSGRKNQEEKAPARPSPPLEPDGAGSPVPPPLSPDIPQRFLPADDIARVTGGALLYTPSLLATGRIHYVNQKMQLDSGQEFSLLAPFAPDGTIRWDAAEEIAPGEYATRPLPDARFLVTPEVPRALKKFPALKQDMVTSLYHTRSLRLLSCPPLSMVSRAGEPDSEFLLQVQLAARERRDAEVDALRKRYAGKIDSLEDRLRKAERTVHRKQADADARKREAMLSAGESVLGVLLGSRSARSGSAAAGKYRQSSAAGMSAREAEENAHLLSEEISRLSQELERETTAISTRWEGSVRSIEEVRVKPRKSDIMITSFLLAWLPRQS